MFFSWKKNKKKKEFRTIPKYEIICQNKAENFLRRFEWEKVHNDYLRHFYNATAMEKNSQVKFLILSSFVRTFKNENLKLKMPES